MALIPPLLIHRLIVYDMPHSLSLSFMNQYLSNSHSRSHSHSLSQGAGDMVVVCGGVIPQQDYDFLYKAGVSAVFGPGTKLPVAVLEVLKAVENKKKQTTTKASTTL